MGGFLPPGRLSFNTKLNGVKLYNEAALDPGHNPRVMGTTETRAS